MMMLSSPILLPPMMMWPDGRKGEEEGIRRKGLPQVSDPRKIDS